MNTLTEPEIWEKYSSLKQIKIRNKIEEEAQELNIPPSCHEMDLIEKGELTKDWDFNPLI